MAAHLDHDGACERDEAVAAPRRLATRAPLHPLRTAGRALASLEVPAQSGPSEDASIALRGYLAALRRGER